MTFQPPPPPPGTPPPGGTPPPPPPGQWGPPPGGQPGRPGGSFDPKSVNPLDWGIVGIGAVLLIFSFFGYYSFDIPSFSVGGTTVGGGSESLGAWHTSSGTFIPWLAFLVAFAGAVVVALELFVPTVKLPFAARLISLILFAASVVLYILGFLVVDLPSEGSFGFSYYVSFILAIAGTALALMRAQQTNTALPGPLSNIPKIGS